MDIPSFSKHYKLSKEVPWSAQKEQQNKDYILIYIEKKMNICFYTIALFNIK